jgi:Tfp pilus assembly PilM family ATPase
MSNPVSTEQLQDEIIKNLRLQLETHRHMLRVMSDPVNVPNEAQRASVRDFLKLPWGMR